MLLNARINCILNWENINRTFKSNKKYNKSGVYEQQFKVIKQIEQTSNNVVRIALL